MIKSNPRHRNITRIHEAGPAGDFKMERKQKADSP